MSPYNRRRSRDGISFLWFVERVWLGKKIGQRYGSEMVVLFRSCLARRMTLVHSKSNYCNSLFLNLDSIQIQRLQLIENSLARAVTRTSRPYHINGVLKSLHWLEIPERTHFKVLSLTYNSLQPSKLTYLRQLFTIRGVAVVEWLRSRPLDCEVRGSNHDQGRHLKTKISASGAHQRW